MMEDMTRHIRQCERCLQFKASPDRAPMENVNATYPTELVHMDYLTIEATEGGKDVYILVVTTISQDMHKLLSLACKQLSVQLRICGINS